MSSTLTKLYNKKLIRPPEWLKSNVMYEVMMGSIVYGVSNKTSDIDIYGFAIPPKADVFPNLKGLIPGFDNIELFEQYQQHHIFDKDENRGKGQEYDLTIYNITKYFKLCMENNPNIIDSLFVDTNFILYTNEVGNMVRENRHLFLHKGLYHKFIGYARSQLHKAAGHKRTGKRKELYDKYGMDCKFLYHLVRLAHECDMLLSEHDLDLQRHKEHLKAIRRGEVSEQEIRNWFSEKEKTLEKLYRESKIRATPPVDEIRQLLINCLEHHYRTLENCFVNPNKEKQILEEIKKLLN